MKHTLISLACCAFLLTAPAQKAEKIYANARQQKPVSYYKEQSVAWKKVVDEHPKDANAWYNYFYANRNLVFNDRSDTRSPKEQNAFMDQLVDDMGKQVPESYEYNICKWMVSGFDPARVSFLKKAAELGEGRTEHLDYMINDGELNRDIKERELYSKKKFEAGQFSSGIIYYNYNVLMGLDQNAIILTCGDNDTYPIWLLQAQGLRKDISVINLALIGLEDYRNKLFDELGIDRWQAVADPKAGKTEADHERYRNGIVKHIAANKKKYPVYIALSAAERYTKAIEQNLYLTGLAYLYSEKPVDNIALLKKNVEQMYALDYIDKPFYQEISPDLVKNINGNYLVPMLTLYDHYKLAGDVQKEAWLKDKLLAISNATENETEIKKRLAQNR